MWSVSAIIMGKWNKFYCCHVNLHNLIRRKGEWEWREAFGFSSCFLFRSPQTDTTKPVDGWISWVCSIVSIGSLGCWMTIAFDINWFDFINCIPITGNLRCIIAALHAMQLFISKVLIRCPRILSVLRLHKISSRFCLRVSCLSPAIKHSSSSWWVKPYVVVPQMEVMYAIFLLINHIPGRWRFVLIL